VLYCVLALPIAEGTHADTPWIDLIISHLYLSHSLA
ncbi:MAG: hypothetical protein ACI906_005118, partial [Candidatus Latescibacterota bacterium]